MVRKQKEISKTGNMPALKIPDVAEEPKLLSPKIQKLLNQDLLEAAKRKQWKRVGCLLDGGAKAEEKDGGGFSALTYAATEGQSKLVQKMIAAGVNVSLKDFASRAAFIKAHVGGHKETAELLLDAGKLGAGNSRVPLPPLTREQEEVVAEIEESIWNGELP